MQHLAVIGAGPHGLAVLSALAERDAWPARVTVIDPSEGWCAAWDAKLARLDLDRLRSPQVHHPGVHPMALRDLVEALPEPEQLALRRPEAERVPTPAGMRRFVDRLAAALGPTARLRGTATRVQLVRDGASRVTGVGIRVEAPGRSDLEHPASSQIGVETVEADAAVLAHNPSFPRLPAWADRLLDEGRAVHAARIDVRTDPATAGDVLIVGGGLTAACLALAVDARGGRATVLTRRPLRARPYDVDASWIGPRHLAGFAAAGPADRRRLIDVARDGGTVPPRTLAQLRDRATGPGARISLVEGVDVEAEVRARLAARPGAALWLATGFEQDLRRDPLTAPIVAELGTVLHGGLPEVTEGLALGAAPVHVIGPYAALGVGPACRNLAGARPAAARIAAALAGG